jgi:hypothetical protein
VSDNIDRDALAEVERLFKLQEPDPWASLLAEVRAEIGRVSDGGEFASVEAMQQRVADARYAQAQSDHEHTRAAVLSAIRHGFIALRALDREASR